jgi:hypothetical protein
MRTYAATVRRELLRHRDGAKTFSGTTLTDPEVVRRQEVTFDTLVRQGFRLPDATLGLVLLHDFTIGFCVEEQAVNQAVAAGDERDRVEVTGAGQVADVRLLRDGRGLELLHGRGRSRGSRGPMPAGCFTAYHQAELELEADPGWRPYREILSAGLARAAEREQVTLPPAARKRSSGRGRTCRSSRTPVRP